MTEHYEIIGIREYEMKVLCIADSHDEAIRLMGALRRALKEDWVISYRYVEGKLDLGFKNGGIILE